MIFEDNNMPDLTFQGESLIINFRTPFDLGQVALEEGRRAVGFELKDSYHRMALANVEFYRRKLEHSAGGDTLLKACGL
jgi:hypothetical protein